MTKKPLTQAQRECLEFLREGPATLGDSSLMTRRLSPTEFYSMPIRANASFLRLIARGFVRVNRDGEFSITPAGRSYIAKVRA